MHKYSRRGFGVLVPGLDLKRVNQKRFTGWMTQLPCGSVANIVTHQVAIVLSDETGLSCKVQVDQVLCGYVLAG